MDIVEVQVPGEGSGVPVSVFAEGNLLRITGDRDTGYTLEFSARDILVMFYHFSIHRVAFITAHASVPAGNPLSVLEFVGSPRIILSRLSGRSFDRFKRALYMLKKEEPHFYSFSWIFWLRFAWLMRMDRNSRDNIRQLVEIFRGAA